MYDETGNDLRSEGAQILGGVLPFCSALTALDVGCMKEKGIFSPRSGFIFVVDFRTRSGGLLLLFPLFLTLSLSHTHT